MTDILKFLQCIITISLFNPIGKLCGRSFAHYPRTHCAKFGGNWHDGSGEENENVKILQSDRQTDGWKLGDHKNALRAFSLGELKTQKIMLNMHAGW